MGNHYVEISKEIGVDACKSSYLAGICVLRNVSTGLIPQYGLLRWDFLCGTCKDESPSPSVIKDVLYDL